MYNITLKTVDRYIQIKEEDIKNKGDAWGIKQRQIQMINEDIKRLKNERIIEN